MTRPSPQRPRVGVGCGPPPTRNALPNVCGHSAVPGIPPAEAHHAAPVLTFPCTGSTVAEDRPSDRDDGDDRCPWKCIPADHDRRSEEHTSELQSRLHLVCRLLLEKKK